MKPSLFIPIFMSIGLAVVAYLSFSSDGRQVAAESKSAVTSLPTTTPEPVRKLNNEAPQDLPTPVAQDEEVQENCAQEASAVIEMEEPNAIAEPVPVLETNPELEIALEPEEEPPFPPAPENPRLNKQREDLVYYLPTKNDELFHDHPEGFFMYVDRIFEGEASRPWTGGRFGFVRTAFRNSEGEIMHSKLHEGIDISPVERDENDEPQDMVHAIAKGVVVHTSAVPGRSNYGRYVVVSHDLPEGTFYSLYAHLAEVLCQRGDEVDHRSVLGRMGYSGVGINKRRAHLHLELCYMINSEYEDFSPKSNLHGNHNGLNLLGINLEDILLASRGERAISLSDYLHTQKELYRVRVPNEPRLDFITRYPFLLQGREGAQDAPTLDFVFTAEGIPLAVYPSDESLRYPKVLSSQPMPTLLQNCTSNRLKNNSKNPKLTINGQRFIQTFTQRAK